MGLCSQSKRDKARRLIREQRPILLIGSPMCTQFSTWQYLNFSKSNDQAAMKRAYAGACVHMKFVAELYHEQIEGNRYFLHEHPRYATSWQLDCIQRLQNVPGVDTVRGDQCQFGAIATKGLDQGCPIKKPSGFMSNSIEIRHALSRVCEGRNGGCSRPEGGRHTVCQGSLTKGTATYPRELCRAVLRGLTAQLRKDRRLIAGCFGIQADTDLFQADFLGLDPELVGEEHSVRKHVLGPAQGYSGRNLRSALVLLPSNMVRYTQVGTLRLVE